MKSFENASLQEILAQAKRIINQTIYDLNGDTELRENDKGAIGNVIQSFGFGIKENNDAAPDFTAAGVELKIIPLYTRTNGHVDIKERTKICSIDYQKLIKEEWETSKVKSKISKMLFIFYEYNKHKPKSSKILQYYLFDLNTQTAEETQFRKDWEKAKAMVKEGLAHELSESLFTYLATTTSGSGGKGSIVSQPVKDISPTAKKRSFSFKPSYTRVIWKELKGTKFDSLYESPVYNKAQGPEQILLDSLHKFQGKSIEWVAKKEGLVLGSSKDFTAKLIRSALGFKGKFKPIREIEQAGITLKILPVRDEDLRPFEAISFPFQPFKEVIDEESFFESDLHQRIRKLLIVPVIATSRKCSTYDKIIGKAFIYILSNDEIAIVKKEWELYKQIISSGLSIRLSHGRRITNLPKESETKIIHMRPHGANGMDFDESYRLLNIVKHSFWINKSFLQEKLHSSYNKRAL